MSTSTDLFESYSQELDSIVGEIKKKLESAENERNIEARKATLRRVEMEIEEGDEIIAQMELESASAAASMKPALQTRVRASTSELGKLKEAVRNANNDAKNARSLLGLGNNNDPSSPVDDGAVEDQRQRLLTGTDKLADGQRRLEESHRIALETQDIGAETLSTLVGQRQQIEHTRDTLYSADSSIDRASVTLKKMIRRMYRQRVISVVIILVLVALIIIVLWSKLS